MELKLTDEQLKALQRTIESAYPDEATRPTLEDFLTAAAQEKLNEIVAIWRQRDVDALKSRIEQRFHQFTPEDIAVIAGVAEKYEPAKEEPAKDNAVAVEAAKK